jgi:2,3-bisphosphoglycerate-independent phosphoglycerate mutase
MTIFYIMVDGVGLAAEPAPPWSSARLRTLPALLGALPTAALRVERAELLWAPLDATMGVPGLPQSGSGHTALYTGQNAAAFQGCHQPAFPGPTLRPLIAEHSLLRRVAQLGLRPYQATAYPASYWELAAARRLKPTAGALAAQAAGLELPSLPDVIAGRALTWDITGAYIGQRRPELAALGSLAPEEAGRRLAALAPDYDLVLFECYLPDFVGHRRIELPHEEPLELVDAFLGGLLAALRPADSVVLVSDHGNLEEPAHRQHTRNPVPLGVVGPAAPFFTSVRAIEEVAPAILKALPSA